MLKKNFAPGGTPTVGVEPWPSGKTLAFNQSVFCQWTKSAHGIKCRQLSLRTTFVYTNYTSVRVSVILNNITLITIVILVLFYRNTNNHAISRYRRICRNHSAIWRLSKTHINAYWRTPPCLAPPSGGTPWDIDVIYTPLKSAFNGLQFRRWRYRSIFIRLAVVASQSREITRNSDKIWPYSSLRSSKVIDLGVNRKPMYDFLLVINSNFGRVCYRFRDIHG